LKFLKDQQTSRGNDDSRWDEQEQKEPVARFFRHAVVAALAKKRLASIIQVLTKRMELI
jgi:hypothetical protein